MKKVKEKSDKYYLTKYQMTEEQLADYKKRKEEIGDSDLIIEDLIEPEISLKLSMSAKIDYLTKLRNKIITILWLIEQLDKNPESSNPDTYIQSLLIDINGANLLFEDALTEIYVKIYGIYVSYRSSNHSVIRRQVLETRRLVDDLLTDIKEGKDGDK